MSHLMQLFEPARFPGGVEVHTDGLSATMTLDGAEHGSLRFFPLGPGAILSFNRIYTQVWPLAQTETDNILLLNFCLNGRCEVDLDNGQCCSWTWMRWSRSPTAYSSRQVLT